MRGLFFILVGIALTLGAIYYMGPDEFMRLYKGVVSTGEEIAAGGGVEVLTDKLNSDDPSPAGGAAQ